MAGGKGAASKRRAGWDARSQLGAALEAPVGCDAASTAQRKCRGHNRACLAEGGPAVWRGGRHPRSRMQRTQAAEDVSVRVGQSLALLPRHARRQLILVPVDQLLRGRRGASTALGPRSCRGTVGGWAGVCMPANPCARQRGHLPTGASCLGGSPGGMG